MKIVELLLMGLRRLWQANSLSPVEVHELEEEDASLGAHGDAEDEHEDADADGEHAAVLEQVLRPVVHDPRDQRLHVAELGVDAKNLERGFGDVNRKGSNWQLFRVDSFPRA